MDIHEQKGFATIYEYAGRYAGLSKSVAEAGVHKVAKRVREMSKASLQQLVKEVRCESGDDQKNGSKTVESPERSRKPQLQIALDAEMEFLFFKLKKKLGGKLSNREALRRLLKNLEKLEGPTGKKSLCLS